MLFRTFDRDQIVPRSKAIMVDFTDDRPWCGPCMQLRDEYEKAALALFAGKFHRVGQNCATWPSVLNENPYRKHELHLGPQFGPTL